MFKAKMSIPPDLFAFTKDLPTRVKRRFNEKVRNTVQPELQRQVDDLLGTEPGPVRYPFAFATERSRRFYFAAFRDRIPYRRTGALAKGWKVLITRQGQSDYMTIVNAAPEAQYVYGTPFQRQVPGHRNTGWGRENKIALALIQEHGTDLLVTAALEALYEGVKG